jgi:hypothetical protein
LNLEKLEQLAKAATDTGLPGDRMMFAIHAMDPDDILELTAEVRRLREALNTPVFTCGYSQHVNALVGLEGVHWDVAYDVFANSNGLVTVFYGEKRVYTSMAEFCAAHPRGKS